VKLLIGLLALHSFCSVTVATASDTVTVTGEITAVYPDQKEVIITPVSTEHDDKAGSLPTGASVLVQLADAAPSYGLADAAERRQPHCNLNGKRVQFSGHYLDDGTFLADSVSSVADGRSFHDKTGVRFRLNKRNGRCGFQ